MKQTKVVALISALLFCGAHAQTEAPTVNTTQAPTVSATEAPTIAATEVPTTPTTAATEVPTVTTEAPTIAATEAPTTPTTAATEVPTVTTTEAPTIGAVTGAPIVTTTEAPTIAVTEAQTGTTTEAPTIAVTEAQTGTTTEAPAIDATEAPTTTTTTTTMTEKTAAPTDVLTGSPTSSPTILDDEEPSPPGTPVLTGLASTTVSFTWDASTDNVAVTRYDIYDGATLIGNATTNKYTAFDLEPNKKHGFTVVALDAAENESPASGPLEVHTTVLVDNFDDDDNVAEDDWGLWFATCNGTLMNGGSSLRYLPGYNWGYNPDGSNSSGAQVDYEVDGGEWGYCNLFLNFNEDRYTNNGVDLTASNITGIQFQFQGSEGSTVYLQLGTQLAEWNWIYYKYELKPKPGFKTIKVNFGEFVAEAEEEVPYSISDALASATSLVWEVNQVGRAGWFMLDNVDFTTTSSHPGDVTSGAITSPSFVVSIFISVLSIGIMQW